MALTSGINNLVPSPTKGSLFQNNYITDFNFTKQFLPDVYEKEAEIYGNRSISSFLRMVSAEMPSTSDEIRWVEQGRLHVAYNDVALVASTGVFTVTHPANPDGTAFAASGSAAIRAGQTIMVQGKTSGGVASGPVLKGVVVTAGAAAAGATSTFTAHCYSAATWAASGFAVTNGVNVLVYGSEFAKGTAGMDGAIESDYSSYTNKPIILKDNYQVSGSDTAQIGWIEVASENGASGYLWYLKSEHETRQRFEDYLEMSMVESVKKGSTVHANFPGSITGSEGFFAALESRGNVYTDLAADADTIASFDTILKQLDKNGAIEENMLYTNRALSLAIDDGLAAKNSYGSGGTSYGVFNNSEDMALNLGFSGFRRGSYDFYKTDWKYLNDFGTRGQFGDIEGALIPAGTSTVYDQDLGKNIKRPFLHIRYRSSETDDRKMKTWITGSVGGAYTSDIDEMRVNFLSERCLITQGANNFFLLKD
tara:strand:- start:818 stop:2257 length:1440 start_codon:yes stop_codon:yes gene_type:complete